MKKKLYILLLLFPLWGLGGLSCNNDDDNSTQDPLSQLPPMTTTGENTIGCLVNGEPFTDSGLMNNFYQFVNGEHILVINWTQGPNSSYKDGQLVLKGILIQENVVYTLKHSSYVDGDYMGGGATFTSNISELFGQFETNQNFTGEIYFTRFDDDNNIMSGTFSFEAQEIFSNEIVSITNGRFDLTFTN
jgi:hypothetical protein